MSSCVKIVTIKEIEGKKALLDETCRVGMKLHCCLVDSFLFHSLAAVPKTSSTNRLRTRSNKLCWGDCFEPSPLRCRSGFPRVDTLCLEEVLCLDEVLDRDEAAEGLLMFPSEELILEDLDEVLAFGSGALALEEVLWFADELGLADPP